MGQDLLPSKTAEIIKNCFYFSPNKPKCLSKIPHFSIDDELIYEGFNSDFGPLNLAQLYKYCVKIKERLKQNKPFLHYTHAGPEKLDNAAYLAGSYAIIFLNKNANEIYDTFDDLDVKFIPFRDASLMPTHFTLTLKNVFEGVEKALSLGFLNFDHFNLEEYEHYEKVENGDLNWIIPGKMLAFCGPESNQNLNKSSFFSKNFKETPTPGLSNANCNHHPPAFFIPYFRKHRVGLVIRLNEPDKYDPSEFTIHGIAHKDLFFPDGAIPTEQIVIEFLELCRLNDANLLPYQISGVTQPQSIITNGHHNIHDNHNPLIPQGIAVHCKAGLGRTGTLIACYIMSKYKFTAREAISWIRICRPGSVLGHQQNYLEKMQDFLWQFYETHPLRKLDSNSITISYDSETTQKGSVTSIPLPSPPATVGPRHYFHSPLKNLRSRKHLSNKLETTPTPNNSHDLDSSPHTSFILIIFNILIPVFVVDLTRLEGGKILFIVDQTIGLILIITESLLGVDDKLGYQSSKPVCSTSHSKSTVLSTCSNFKVDDSSCVGESFNKLNLLRGLPKKLIGFKHGQKSANSSPSNNSYNLRSSATKITPSSDPNLSSRLW